MSVFNESRPSTLETATIEDNLTKIHNLILADYRLKVREIAETVGIGNGPRYRVGHILLEILGM